MSNPRCEVCGHTWGAYEDTCHCDGPCHNSEGCPEAHVEIVIEASLAGRDHDWVVGRCPVCQGLAERRRQWGPICLTCQIKRDRA